MFIVFKLMNKIYYYYIINAKKKLNLSYCLKVYDFNFNILVSVLFNVKCLIIISLCS